MIPSVRPWSPLALAYSFFGSFRSRCQGVGYWSHFFIGALLGVCFIARFSKLHAALWTLFLSYQLCDYFWGTEDEFSAEGALARDVGEYVIGYAFVLIGAALERRNHQRKQS